jgi:hypothetical protein
MIGDTGGWPLVTGPWSLASGYWLLAISQKPLSDQNSIIAPISAVSQKPFLKMCCGFSQPQEASSQKLTKGE